jgi:hypothetical protein
MKSVRQWSAVATRRWLWSRMLESGPIDSPIGAAAAALCVVSALCSAVQGEEAYHHVMLAETVPDAVTITRINCRPIFQPEVGIPRGCS